MSNAVCSARVYLRRGETKAGAGILKRMFGKQLEHEIVEHALRAGLDFASVTHGQSGFAFGAKRVSAVGPETAGEGLPICIELLGDREDVARFIDEHSALLAGATVVLFDGVRISTVGED